MPVTGDVRITDNDWPGDDTSQAFVFGEECIVDPFDRDDAFHWSRCVDEVRVDVDVSCHLGTDNTSVDVAADAVLFEGTGCGNTDRDGSQKWERLAPMCGTSCTPIPLDMTVHNTEEKGGDSAVFRLQIQNSQR
jgi:hypothetical protein